MVLHPHRDGPGTILTPFFSLIRPNYSNMKWPYNCLVKKIVIGQIDRSISHQFYSRINLFCKKIQSRGGFLEQPGIAYLEAWFTKKSFLDKVKSQAVNIQALSTFIIVLMCFICLCLQHLMLFSPISDQFIHTFRT